MKSVMIVRTQRALGAAACFLAVGARLGVWQGAGPAPPAARAQEGGAGSRAVTVRGEGPRIFLRPEQFGAWRVRFRQGPALRETYAATRRDLFGRTQPAENLYLSAMELPCFARLATDPRYQRRRPWLEMRS